MDPVFGPSPRGTWTSHLPNDEGSWPGKLMPGHRYRVVQEFADFDHVVHPVGETWTFLGEAYFPYDDGTSLFVSLDGKSEWHIRMQGSDEEQGRILGDMKSYVQPAPQTKPNEDPAAR